MRQTSLHAGRSRPVVAERSYRDADQCRRITPCTPSCEVSGKSPGLATGDDPWASPGATVPGWKRRLDILCIVLGLPLMLPLMIIIALWIKLVSRGPALLRQERIGLNGRPFVLYKLRSMAHNTSTAPQAAYVRGLVKADRPMIKLELIKDSRLIVGGGLIRATGLDELPQVLNVLRGEMSLVGPRPCLPGEYGLFSAKQRERFNALPGITGIWQVEGKNRSTFREMNVMDIHYVRNASVRMDVQIMMRTPAALLLQLLLAFRHRRAGLRRAAFAQSVNAIDPQYTARRHSQLL